MLTRILKTIDPTLFACVAGDLFHTVLLSRRAFVECQAVSTGVYDCLLHVSVIGYRIEAGYVLCNATC